MDGAMVFAVNHAAFLERPLEQLLGKLAPGGVVADVKSALDPAAVRALGYRLWRL